MCAHRFAFARISLRLRTSRIISDLDDDTVTCLRLCESETESRFNAALPPLEVNHHMKNADGIIISFITYDKKDK